ncbi:hypothetical protein ACFLYG_01355 [Chloroflexota bacterium]
MAEKVQVTMVPTAFVITAGDIAEATATVRNVGQTVDQFTFSIDGLNPDWYNFSTFSVALFPNDQEIFKIFIHPTKSAESRAGSHTFHLIVASQENPDEKASVELTLEVKVVPKLKLDITPQRIIGRRGTYRIVASNPGEKTATLQLEAVDDEAILHYSLRPKHLTVPSGGHSESLLELRLGLMDFFIGERECDFQILATLSDTDEVRTVSGQIVTIPWYRPLQQIRLPRVKMRALMRPPTIVNFMATTEDNRKFKLIWLVKRADEIKLDDVDIDQQGEKEVTPTKATSYVLTASNKHGNISQTVDVQPIVIPEGKASDRIRVLMLPAKLEVSAGGIPVISTLEVQNMGEIVDKFSVEIEGLEESWYSRSASSIALMPQATDQVQISFHPPKMKGVQSGTYPFAVAVRSQSRQEESTIVTDQVEVLPSAEFTMNVAPIRISCRRKARFRINLANSGVSNTEIFIEATDYDESLRFSIKNKSPIVDAWQTIEIPIIAKPKRGSIVGERKRYDITIAANTADGNPQSVRCEMYHRPFIGSWRPIKALIILAVVALVVHYIVGFGGGWSDLFKNPQEWLYTVIRHVRGWFS